MLSCIFFKEYDDIGGTLLQVRMIEALLMTMATGRHLSADPSNVERARQSIHSATPSGPASAVDAVESKERRGTEDNWRNRKGTDGN